MFAVIVSLRVKPGMTAKFLRAMTANAAASLRDEPGCVRFDILRDNADPGRFVLYELYTDEDTFRSKHLTALHFAQWRADSSRHRRGGQPGRRVLHTSEPELERPRCSVAHGVGVTGRRPSAGSSTPASG